MSLVVVMKILKASKLKKNHIKDEKYIKRSERKVKDQKEKHKDKEQLNEQSTEKCRRLEKDVKLYEFLKLIFEIGKKDLQDNRKRMKGNREKS